MRVHRSMGSSEKGFDCLSTVTNLISLPKHPALTSNWKPSSRDQSQSEKSRSSCSSQLDRYIKNYEKRQIHDLAEALTYNIPVRIADKENELQKEIHMARGLLGNSTSTTASEDICSLTTDDLLTINFHGLNGSGKVADPVISEHKFLLDGQPVMISTPSKKKAKGLNSIESASMQLSEIAATLRSQFPDVFESSGSDATSNLFSLNGATYTPHKIKHKSILKEINDNSQITSVYSCTTKKSSEWQSDDSVDSQDSAISQGTLTIHAGRTPYRRTSGYKQSTGSLETSTDTSTNHSFYSIPVFPNTLSDTVEFVKTEFENTEQQIEAVGSVETLKNMLFTLQSVTTTSESDDMVECRQKSSKKLSVCDGHSSLRNAMSHLSNLQNLLT